MGVSYRPHSCVFFPEDLLVGGGHRPGLLYLDNYDKVVLGSNLSGE